MSIKLHVYVGPYLLVDRDARFSIHALTPHENRMFDLYLAQSLN